MKVNIHNKISEVLPYKEIREIANNFTIGENKIIGVGKVKKQASSGRSMYAEVKIEIEKCQHPSSISWEVSELEIPFEYFDTLLITYKSIFDLGNIAINLKIIGGSFHNNDSNPRSFEIATFKAIADILDFKSDKLKVYQIS